jgi:hypothetical protein
MGGTLSCRFFCACNDDDMAGSLQFGGATVAFLGAGRELMSRGALRPSLDSPEECAHRKQIANLFN